jgi:hypothetical protein
VQPNLSFAYLLAAFSFFGVAGLNRFYLGKPVTGIIWFFTGGLFLVGSIYDFITMERQVAEAAARRGLRPAPVPRPALNPNPEVDLELRVLRLARHQRGRLTITLTASELGLPVAEAEAQLDKLTAAGHADIDVTDDGVIVYDFPSLRLATA